MTIFVLLVPYAYHIDNGPGPDSLVAMIWDLRFDTPEFFFLLMSPLWIFFEYVFFRILSLIINYIYLGGKIKTKYVISAGIIADLLVLLISIPRIFIMNSEGENLSPILIPIPTLLIFNILFVYIISKFKQKI